MRCLFHIPLVRPPGAETDQDESFDLLQQSTARRLWTCRSRLARPSNLRSRVATPASGPRSTWSPGYVFSSPFPLETRQEQLSLYNLSAQLERFGQLDEAASIWEGLSKTHSTSYLVWIGWSEFETCVKPSPHRLSFPFTDACPNSHFLAWIRRRPAVPRARTVFEKALRKPAALDWPEAVFSAYLAFEEMYGSLDTLDQARESVETAQTAVAAKRHKVSALLEPVKQSTGH